MLTIRRALVLAATLGACSRSPAPAPAPAPTPTTSATPASVPTATPTAAPPPSATATATATPTAAAAPAKLPVTSASATVSGREQPLGAAGVTVVDPGAQFHVDVPLALDDARLSLLDSDGAMVAATGGAEIGAGRTRFHLAPDAPLVPGSAYTLKLDGAVDRDPLAPDGRSYPAATWGLQTTGEKPKAPPRKQKERHHRRR